MVAVETQRITAMEEEMAGLTRTVAVEMWEWYKRQRRRDVTDTVP